MAASRSAEGIWRARTPRWVLLIPLVASFVVFQRELWGWQWCGRHGAQACDEAMSTLSWSMAVFPHILVFPLSPFVSEPWQICAVISALDALLVAAMWMTQPSRLSWMRLTIILAAWIALSVAMTLSAPGLMAWGYGATG